MEVKTNSITLCLITLLTFNLQPIHSGEFLLLVPFGSQSHKNLFSPVAKALALKGHQTVIASLFEPKKQQPNVTEVVLTNLRPQFEDIRYYTILEGVKGSTSEIAEGFMKSCTEICEEFFKTPTVQGWVKRSNLFDVVIVDGVLSECLFPFSHLVGKSVVALNTATLFPWIAQAIDSPYPLSFIPFLLLPYKEEMNFFERVKSVFMGIKWDYLEKSIIYPVVDQTVKKYFPNAKTVSKAMEDLSFVLVNADPVLTSVKPQVPNLATIGGIQCKPAKALPKELDEFVKSAGEDGFIIFSLGSIFSDSMMTADKKKKLFEAFTRLKIKVLMKYDAKLEGVPPNVKVVKWIPQQDLLGHPKCRSFITHSGLLSLQESLYHGIPTVTIPLFAEQPSNAAHCDAIGISVHLDWNSFTADDIVHAVQKTLEPDFQARVKKYSEIFKEQQITAEETAVYWMEHLVKNPKAPNLRVSNPDLNFFQYFVLDIVCFIVFIIGIILFSAVKIVRLMSREY